MQHMDTSYTSELHISPQIVLATLTAVGIVVELAGDSVPEGSQLLIFGLIIHGLTALAWLVAARWQKLGSWLTVLTLIFLLLLGDIWLRIPDTLFLMGIPAIFAMAMMGFPAALAVSALETVFLLVSSPFSSAGNGLVGVRPVLLVVWTTLAALYLLHRRSHQLARWSWTSYQAAQVALQAARDERMMQKQLEADLLLANGELARLSNYLKAMQQLAEEARQAKEQFVANVSHELRTPLNMIIGFSDIISRSSAVYGTKLPPTLLADIAAIQRNSQHLARLVDDVLDLSQIESNRMALSKEWVSLKEIVDQAITAVRTLYDAKGLYLRAEIPSDLRKIFCDGTRIRQVIINLLSNAGRFTEEGGVRVTARCDQNEVLVSVVDTGPGIAPEDQQRLFEPFYQVDSSLRRRHGGSGLGLSISKQFVEMHQGRMWLESEVGVGTAFYFCLPLQLPLPALVSGGYGMRYNPYAQFDGRTEPSKAPAPQVIPRFVLLEKGDTLRRLLVRYKEGIEVIAVQNVADAIQELNRSPAQAVLVNAASFSDQSAPLERMIDLPYNTPVITCWIDGEDQAARQLGVVRYLVKPISYETLTASLAQLGDHIETVLLVDDDRQLLQLFARQLLSAERPYRVLQTTSGRRALGLLRERQPDVMVLDLGMPRMDGYQILEQKRKDASICHIPVVVISATDPTGQPIVSHHLSVSYGSGLSASNLLDCIQAVSEVLSPGVRPAGRASPEILPA